MRQLRLLAVAPRPCDDELLSCWHWRVASHYSTSPPQVESWISGSTRGQNQDFFSRDFHPNQAVIGLWARACRIREGDLDRLSLRSARRPKTSFVSDPMDRGVCPCAWMRMPKRGGTTIAGDGGQASKQWSVLDTESASRITVLGVFAAVCFSFGRHPPVLSGCFAVIVGQSSRRGVFRDAIKLR